jgi:hypothetical protein
MTLSKLITVQTTIYHPALLTCLVLITACERTLERNDHLTDKPMKEHQHHHPSSPAGLEKEYAIVFRSEPAGIKAGKAAKLYFTPKEKGRSGSAVPLDLVHEMKFHLFIMSRDLSYFAHEHPEQARGGSLVWEHTFPFGGEYVLFQDYTPTGSGHQLGRQVISVAGKEQAPVRLGKEDLVWEGNGYQVTLSSEVPLKADTGLELKASVLREGKPVTDLDNYLGALSHVVIVSEDASEFVHVHPMESATKGPDIRLHTKFPGAGMYKVFMQFKHQGKVQTASFVVAID